MSAHVNAIRILESKPQKFRGLLNSFQITIDGKPLEIILENAAKQLRCQWPDKSDTVVCLEELHRSVVSSGPYNILVGSHCLLNGLDMPEDVGLNAIDVAVDNEYIIWKVSFLPFDSANLSSNAGLYFRFHKPQLEKAVAKLPPRTLVVKKVKASPKRK